MTKADGGQQHSNQPTKGSEKAGGGGGGDSDSDGSSNNGNNVDNGSSNDWRRFEWLSDRRQCLGT
jgi:hypothetical protein